VRKIVVQEMLTADGVMQGPGGPDEDRSDGFEYGGWQGAYEMDEDQFQKLADGITDADAFLLGRRTYDIFAGYWPNQADDFSFAKVMNSRPKYVVSRSLSEPLAWQNALLVQGDVVKGIRELKNQGSGQITVIGSGELVQTLLANDLADELSLFVSPLVLATGKKLFRDGLPWLNLELLDSLTSAQYGSQWLRFRPTVKMSS